MNGHEATGRSGWRGDPAAPQLVLVAGRFDGLHRGHRQLVDEARAVATRRTLPLQALVLDDGDRQHQLMPVAERCESLVRLGATRVLACHIGQLTDVDSGAESLRVVMAAIQPATVVIACPDDAPQASRPMLRDVLRRVGVVEVHEASRWHGSDGFSVSTDRIRRALHDGAIGVANELLGRAFTLRAQVVHGAGLGRTIGVPTANLGDAHRMIPRSGVYAATVTLPGGGRYAAAVNIGVRPTVEHDGERLVEAHLVDFDGDLYGSTIDVAFTRWLRPEQRFSSIDELVRQLHRDIERARRER